MGIVVKFSLDLALRKTGSEGLGNGTQIRSRIARIHADFFGGFVR